MRGIFPRGFLVSSHQFRGSSECVCLPRGGLSVAKGRATEALDRHLNESLDARILQHIILRGSRLKDHVVGEELWLLTGTGSVALWEEKESLRMNMGDNGRKDEDSHIDLSFAWELDDHILLPLLLGVLQWSHSHHHINVVSRR